MGWKEFADALDNKFDGTGLGVASVRRVVGTRNGSPLCRYCALGAAWRAIDNGPIPPMSMIKAQFGIDDRENVWTVNDMFRPGSESPVDLKARLTFMRAYANGRAIGLSQREAMESGFAAVAAKGE